MDNKIKKEVFDREMKICRKMYQENGKKCNWGNCETCGVIPLLVKLRKGILLEEKKLINEEKNKFLKI